MSEFDLKGILKEHKILVLLIVICLILWFFSRLFQPTNAKVNTKKSYVYTKESTSFGGTTKKLLPVVNLKGRDARKLNREFEKIYKASNQLLSYNYSISGDYLSVVYGIYTYEEESLSPKIEMKTVVFSLSRRKQLTTNEILTKFNYTEKEVQKAIESKLQYFYEDEIEKGIIEKGECNYQGFLELREINFDEPLQLYIENGELKCYKGFNIYTYYNEDEYFEEEDFKFDIS